MIRNEVCKIGASAMKGKSILSVGLGSDDETYRSLLETVVKAVAGACGIQTKILSTPCWELLDAVSVAGMKPDLLFFHHSSITRAMDSASRFIYQRYRPVRITFLGCRIPEGAKILTLHQSREEIVLYHSIRNPDAWDSIGECLNKDIQWILENSDADDSSECRRA